MAAVYTFSLHSTYNSVIITKNSEHLFQCSQHARYLWQHITHKCPRSSLDKLYCTWQNQCFVMPRKLGHPTPLHTVVQTTEPSCNKPSYAVHINLQLIIRKVLTWTFHSSIIRMGAGPEIAYLILVVPTVQQGRLHTSTAEIIKKNGSSPLPILCIAICGGICEY